MALEKSPQRTHFKFSLQRKRPLVLFEEEHIASMCTAIHLYTTKNWNVFSKLTSGINVNAGKYFDKRPTKRAAQWFGDTDRMNDKTEKWQNNDKHGEEILHK